MTDDPFEQFADMVKQEELLVPIKMGGVMYVYWPPHDDEAGIVRLTDIFDFVCANQIAFDRFRHARHWH